MEWAILQFGRFYILGNFGVGNFGVGRFCHLAQKISRSKNNRKDKHFNAVALLNSFPGLDFLQRIIIIREVEHVR